MVRTSSAAVASDDLPMSVANMTFLVDRLGQDCAPLQFIRELTQNAIESVLSTPDSIGEIRWDLDWNLLDLKGLKKLCIIDTGQGMTGEEMAEYINKLSSSIYEQSASGNFGIGAKIAAAPRNHDGLLYLSWKDSIGYMIHLWRNPHTNQYGLKRFAENNGEYWAHVEDGVRPDPIKEHGTAVILLGCDSDERTIEAPSGAPMPSRWILRYLNSRYFRFPDGVSTRSREGWDRPRGDRHNFLRQVHGQKHHLDKAAKYSGVITLADARAHWWILDPEVDTDAGHFSGGGHMAALYQNELYEQMAGRAGVARLQSFGIIFGYDRVIIYVEPDASGHGTVIADAARTQLTRDKKALPWAEWAADFRDQLPDEINDLMEEISARSSNADHRQAIMERLKNIRDLFRFSRYRPSAAGKYTIDDESVTTGGRARITGDSTRGGGDGSRGGRGGGAGDVYALFVTQNGVAADRVRSDDNPLAKWVSISDGTRSAEDMVDRAAKYIPHRNLIMINSDFRVFQDMIHRWEQRYSDIPGTPPVVKSVVREWFEQQLIETILGCLALRESGNWSSQEIEDLWSEEALTAAVLPRYHINHQIKRALGAKLGKAESNVIIPVGV